MDKPVVGVGKDTSLTPVPPVDDAPVEAELSGTVTSSSAGSTPEGSPDWPAPLRHGTQTTRNQLPWRYQEIWFARWCWTNWHLGCMGWSTYWSIHGVLSMYHFLEGVQCNTHSTYNVKCLPSTTHLSIQGNTLDETSQVDSWAGKGVDQRTFGPVATPLPMKNSPKVILVEVQRSVRQHCPEKWVTVSHVKIQ